MYGESVVFDSRSVNLGSLPPNCDVNASDGKVVVSLDSKNIAKFVRIHDSKKLSEGEVLLFYRVRDGAVKFVTNAFFFQEGQAVLSQVSLSTPASIILFIAFSTY